MVEGLKFLPPTLSAALNRLDYSKIYEIRIRADKPVRVNYDGRFIDLPASGAACGLGVMASGAPGSSRCTFGVSHGGVRSNDVGAVILSAAQINEIVLRAAEFSIYAFNGQLSGGFITIRGGIRIGVAGEVVFESGRVKTQKNFGSLVIRIPHEIKGSGNRAFRALSDARNKNMLLISPPGCGKTTILRDIARMVSDAGANVLVVDERNEIAACCCGVPALDVGRNTDVISLGGKDYAFSFGIRSLRPDFIVTDELMSALDIDAVRRSALSGVNVIASLHAGGIDDIKNRSELSTLIAGGVIGRFVVLSQRSGAGTYEQILDENLVSV